MPSLPNTGEILKSILLLAHKYPPFPGVASNRWKHLTFELSQLGHEIDVITVNWGKVEKDNYSVQVHQIPAFYPTSYLSNPSTSKINAFSKKVFRKLLSHTLYPEDEAQWWGLSAIPYASRLIEEKKISTVIATGGPFSANLIGAKLKRKFGNRIALIQDLRDCWSSNPYVNPTPLKVTSTLKKEQFALKNADNVVAITNMLLEEYRQNHSFQGGQVIENGFSKLEINIGISQPKPPRDNQPIVLTHLGNITNGREIPLYNLLETLDKSSNLNSKYSVILIGDIPNRVKSKISKGFKNLLVSGTLSLCPRIKKAEALKKLGESDYALQLNSPEFDYAVSTKIYEYAGLHIPTLSLNYGHEIEDLIIRRDLGYSVHLNKISLDSFLNDLPNLTRNFQYDIEEFEFKNLAKKYSDLIESTDPR